MANRLPLTISVVGTSGSGKTTTIEYLTSRLTKLGFRVGVVKHIHREGFSIDTEGKDTWKHARAGARIVIGSSPNELAVIKKTAQEVKFEEIRRILGAENLDVVLLEGFSATQKENPSILKIVAAKNQRDLNYTLAKTLQPVLAITGRAAKTLGRPRKASIPALDLDREGPVLVTMIRRLLRPEEVKDALKEAAVRHGGACIGLAIGVRTGFIASSAFPRNPSVPKEIICGTKPCIAEALKTLYPETRTRLNNVRNDRISISSGTEILTIQLARKRKFHDTKEVLRAPDTALFDSIRLTS